MCANLRGAQLQSARLQRANLQGASLQGANMRSTNLVGAVLTGANLDGANLVGAILAHASLLGASLKGANLRGADLRWADLRLVSPALSIENMAEELNMVGARTEGIRLDRPSTIWSDKSPKSPGESHATSEFPQQTARQRPALVHTNTSANLKPNGSRAGEPKMRGRFWRKGKGR